MPIALAQEKSVGASGNPVCAMASSVTAGSLLVALIAVKSTSSSVVSIADTLSNRWVISGNSYSASNELSELWIAFSPSGGANTVTATMSLVRDTCMNVSEWTGMAGAQRIGNGGQSDNPSGTAHQSGPETPYPNGESLLIACISAGSGMLPVTLNTAPKFTALTDFTQTTSVFRGAYRIVQPNPVAEQAAWTASVAGASAGILRCFAALRNPARGPNPPAGKGATW